MTTDEEIQKIAKEVYEYQRLEKKKKGDKENMWMAIVLSILVVGATIAISYSFVLQDKNNVDMSHTALSYMSCNELKSLMLDENKNHASDNLYSYAITDISNEIHGKC